MSALNELIVRVAELERRLSRTALHGPVTDVDEQKHRVRLRVGGTDEEPMKSPWIAYAQIAGALKLHSMPSVGQQMTAFAPDGIAEQALAVPMTWSQQNASPSQKKDEHHLTFGQVHITVKGEQVLVKVGDSEAELTPELVRGRKGAAQTAPRFVASAKQVKLRHRNTWLIVDGEKEKIIVSVPPEEGPDPEPNF